MTDWVPEEDIVWADTGVEVTDAEAWALREADQGVKCRGPEVMAQTQGWAHQAVWEVAQRYGLPVLAEGLYYQMQPAPDGRMHIFRPVAVKKAR